MLGSEYKCSVCSEEAKISRGSYKFIESGLDNVTLENIELIHCPHCGNEDPIIPAFNGLMKVLAKALIRKPAPLSGQEIRFLRKYTHKTGEEFGRLLAVDKTTVSKWENGQDVGATSDRLIRLVVHSIGEGLYSPETAAELVNEFCRITEEERSLEISVDSETREYAFA